jgi:hypothetical protein
MNLLKTPDGSRWSRKNITWAIAGVLLSLIVLRGIWAGEYPPAYIIEALVALIVLVLFGTIADKKLKNLNDGSKN